MPFKIKSIEDLRRELHVKEIELTELQSRRGKIATELAKIDKTIAALTGEAAPVKRRGRRGIAKSKEAPVGAENLQFSSKGIRSLRQQMNISQEKFGKLVGVSVNAISQWETKKGKLNLRSATKAKLAKIWGMGSEKALKRQGAPPRKRKKPSKPTIQRRPEKPLGEYIQEILSKAKEGLGTKDITGAVLKAGYKSTSKNFSNVVTVLLGKDKRFERVSPGVFKLA